MLALGVGGIWVASVNALYAWFVERLGLDTTERLSCRCPCCDDPLVDGHPHHHGPLRVVLVEDPFPGAVVLVRNEVVGG